VVEHDQRPWGRYWVLADDEDCKVKRISVRPGARLSLQLHRRRSEHWFVVSGRGVVTLGVDAHDVAAGTSVDIPAGTAHRIQNTGAEALVFVEVQHGTYFGEDDIVRLDDDYGRVEQGLATTDVRTA
jgi:mannose-6-phosphate isomerase